MKRITGLSIACVLCVGVSARAATEEEAPQKGKNEREAAKVRVEKRRSIVKVREILKNEPNIKDVQRAVLKYYRFEPERINRMAISSRAKAIIPEIEFGLDNSIGKSFSNTKDVYFPPSAVLANPGASDPNSADYNPNGYRERQSSTSDNLLWRVRAVWNLDRLVFNSEELDVKSLTSIEENLIREVTTMYFARRRQLANMIISPPEDEEEQLYEKFKLDEMTATLDAMTGGYFGKNSYKWSDE